MTRLQETVAEQARFSLYGDDPPEWLRQDVQVIAEWSRRLFEEAQPATVRAVVLPAFRAPQRPRAPRLDRSVRVYVFGSFRKRYPVTKKVAKLFAPIYAEMQVLPLITPVTTAEWYAQLEHRGRVARDLTKRGLITYLSRDKT